MAGQGLTIDSIVQSIVGSGTACNRFNDIIDYKGMAKYNRLPCIIDYTSAANYNRLPDIIDYTG